VHCTYDEEEELERAVVVMDAFICCNHTPWILVISLNSFLHRASVNGTSVVVPVITCIIQYGRYGIHFWNKIMNFVNIVAINYLGFGLFLTIFFPYFLHLNPSSRTSTSDMVLNATLSLTSLLSLPLSRSLAARFKHSERERERGRERCYSMTRE
jgi:hypothetical protein